MSCLDHEPKREQAHPSIGVQPSLVAWRRQGIDPCLVDGCDKGLPAGGALMVVEYFDATLAERSASRSRRVTKSKPLVDRAHSIFYQCGSGPVVVKRRWCCGMEPASAQGCCHVRPCAFQDKGRQ